MVTNYFNEPNTVYRNEGGLLFLDVTDEVGLGAPSRLRLGFGISMFDADNDGWLDVFVSNGHVRVQLHRIRRKNEPFAQLPQLFRNQSGRRFEDCSREAGDYFATPVVGRGSAILDFDADGRIDLACLNLNDRFALLRNESSDAGGALRLRLVGTTCNRDAIGSRVEASVGNHQIVRSRIAGSSYLSCDEGIVHVGLGTSQSAEYVTVHWSGGSAERWGNLSAGHLHMLTQGTGQKVDP